MRHPVVRALGRRLLPALAVALASTVGNATSVRPMNIVDLLAHSNAIVAGQVKEVTDGFGPGGVPYTEVTLRVTDTIRGEKGETFTFRQFGLSTARKMPDGRLYLGRPPGWPTWRENESALIFLYPQARRTGLRTTVGLGYGKMSIGNGRASNAYDNAGLFDGVKVNRALLDGAEREMFDAKGGPVDAQALRKFLHRAVDGNWVRNGSIANATR